MKTIIEMAGKAFETPGVEPAFRNGFWTVTSEELERFAALVRADEREQGQKWFDAVTAQHKQLILAEREACAKQLDALGCDHCAAAIRARGNT
jgi:hypothetical protein